MSITCPRCGMTSWNPDDVSEGWCGNCHEYTADSVRCDTPGCEEWAVVKVNGRSACYDHLDITMSRAFRPVRQALDQARGEG